MKSNWKIVAFFVLLLFVFTLFWQSTTQAAENSETKPPQQEHIVGEATSFEISQPARDVDPAQGQPTVSREINPRHNPLLFEEDMGQRGTWDRENIPIDPLIASGTNVNSQTPGLDLSFDATGNPTGCGGCSPPDVVGDVGPNHYVHMVNATKVAIFDKSGNPLNTPFDLGSLWSTGNCTGNAGDPIPVYDSIADRWLLSQFASPNHMCIAISQTADPLGSYYLYEFNVTSFPDYFKFGVWPDGYYMSANESTYTAYAFDRAKMLAGDPTATFQKFTGQNNLLLPSDVDGPNIPPANSPNYFYTFKDDSFHGGNDRIELFEFDVDWATPANTTFTLANTFNVASFTYTPCGFFNFNCIRQLGTAQRFDALGEWPMFRFPYRNFSSHETLVGTFSVGGGLGEEGSAIRWFELRDTGSGWTLLQEGTHDPGDGHDRMNASIAMDQDGNIALGYTVSSSTMNPSIRYATRAASDPLGTLQTEASLLEGTGSQTGSNRWGDYSAMSVDPANDCTFWYTNEYYSTNSSTTWSTRVGAFTMPTCGGSDFQISADPTSLEICAPADAIYDVNLSFSPGFNSSVALSAAGNPAGTTATFNPSSVISPTTQSELTISGTGSAAAGSYDIDIIGMVTPTPTHTATVQLNLFDNTPSAVTLLSPANTATDISVTPSFSWSDSPDGSSYLLELSDAIDFSNIVYTTTTSSTSHDLPGANALNFDTWYYWRVTASNVCGSGTTSTEFTFKTLEQPSTLCSAPALAIPDNDPTGVTDVMNVTAMGNIVDMDITLDTTHTWVGDLKFDITHNGNTVSIFDRPGVPGSTFGCSGNDILATINDEGADGNVEDECGAGTPTIAGDFVGGDPPSTSLLSIFDGGDISGDWTITVSDNASGDTGTLNEWCLVPTIDSSDSGVQLSADMAGSGLPGQTVDYTLTITNTGSVTDTFDLTINPEQWPTLLSTSSVTLNPGESTTFTASVTIPGGATNGDEGMSLVIATSQSDPNVDDDAWLTTTAVTYGVMLSADQSDSGNVGSTVTYTVHITNTGGLSNTFDLGASGVWTTTSSLSSISLDVGESESFEVTVAIPADAPNDTMDVATVTASAQSAPSVTDESLLTTTAVGGMEPDYYIYLPLVLNAPE